MKRCLLIIIVIAFVGADVHSQSPPELVSQNSASADDGNPPGRPTLKRRQPASILTSATKVESPAKQGTSSQPATVRISFEGLRDTRERDLLDALRYENALFVGDSLPDEGAIAKALKVIRDSLQSRGYMNSSVEIINDYDSKLVRIRISEGERSQIQDFRFVGSKAFSAGELSSRMTECLAGSKDYPSYSLVMFEYCNRSVLNFVRSRGYLQAEFSELLRELSDKGLTLEVHVKDGPLYRLGNIVIEGANALSVDDVRSLLGTGRGEIPDGGAIGKWLFEDLKKVYGRMGYIQYTAEPVPTFKSNPNKEEGVVDLRVFIEEGKRFTVGSVKFVGFDMAESKLRQLFLIHEGEIFNQELLEQSIDKVNAALSVSLDKDKDVDFKTDDEISSVYIVVKLPPARVNEP
jgi:outer membrane protein assembly factor BamA